MHPSLEIVDHRPWPLPSYAWKWRQSWLDLAFIHYRADASFIRSLLPDGIHLQQFGGSAWVGLVPFRMAGVMRRPLPDFPGLSSFCELNLRTYVEVDGKPGVWFFSLDADSRPVVLGGRHLYGLPYFQARIRQEYRAGWFGFESIRQGCGARFKGRYRGVGEVFLAARGTFEHWATERYCLYSFSKRREICRVEVHHVPWPLQKAEVVIEECNIVSSAGIGLRGDPPVCHFSCGVQALSFSNHSVALHQI